MPELDSLRAELVGYIKRKFYTRSGIAHAADEIVNQAFHDVQRSPEFRAELYNFGYMSVACVRVAYRMFRRADEHERRVSSLEYYAPLIDEDSAVLELERAEDTAAILASLQTLRQIERIIVEERYYGDFTFREISERHGINLNTVLSHHRRALMKLKPALCEHFGLDAGGYYYGKKE